MLTEGDVEFDEAVVVFVPLVLSMAVSLEGEVESSPAAGTMMAVSQISKVGSQTEESVGEAVIGAGTIGADDI